MNEEYTDHNVVCPFCQAELISIEQCVKCGKELNLNKMSALDYIRITAKKRQSLSQGDIAICGEKSL